MALSATGARLMDINEVTADAVACRCRTGGVGIQAIEACRMLYRATSTATSAAGIAGTIIRCHQGIGGQACSASGGAYRDAGRFRGHGIAAAVAMGIIG